MRFARLAAVLFVVCALPVVTGTELASPAAAAGQAAHYRVVRQKQAFVVLDDRGVEIGQCRPWADDATTAVDTVELAGEGLVRWQRTFRLKDGQPKQRVRLTMDFEAAHVCRFAVVPGISWDGNRNDPGNVYQGFSHAGTPWSFAWHRTLIPGATYSEGERHTVALFADVGDPHIGLACSLIPSDHSTVHRLIFPEEEMPVRIVRREGGLQAGRTSVLELSPGQSFAATAWLVLHPVDKPRLGYRHLLDAAWKHLRPDLRAPRSADAIRDLGVAYIKALWDERAKKFCGAMASDGGGPWERTPWFQIGWCGRNGDAANGLLREYLRTNDQSLLEMALACLDTWAAQAVEEPSGPAQVPGEAIVPLVGKKFHALAGDINNLAEGVTEFLRAYDLAGRCGQPRPQYRQLALAICDEAVANQQKDGCFAGYGAEKGEIGGSMVPALLRAYDVTGDTRYLQSARSAMAYYMAIFYRDGYLWGATLDTASIDKETVYPLWESAVRLYEITRDGAYLAQAEELAWYHCAWQITQSIPNVPGSAMDAMCYQTFGGTSVATVHMCADPLGLLAIAPLLKLARYTDNSQWRERAMAIWANATCGISDGTLQLMGKGPRPPGSQDETCNYTDWNYRVGTHHLDNDNPRGSASEWLVIWPSAIRLEVLADPDARALIATIPVEPQGGDPIRAPEPPAGTGAARPAVIFDTDMGSDYSEELLAKWPLDLDISPSGEDVITGHRLLPQTPQDNPVREAYRLWNDALVNGRSSWDQVAVLSVVRPHLFRVEHTGRVERTREGQVRWNAEVDNPRHHLVQPNVSPDALAGLIEELMARPPKQQ